MNRMAHGSAAGSGSQTNAQGLLTMTLTEGPVLGGGAFSRVSIVTEEVCHGQRGSVCRREMHSGLLLSELVAT